VTEPTFNKQLAEHLPKIKNFIKSRFNSSSKEWREDLLQEVCLKAWQGYNSLENKDYFCTWVIRIASNTGINRTRGLDRWVPMDMSDFVDSTLTADSRMFAKQIATELSAAIDTLPHSQRESFKLFYLEDMAFKDVAEIVGGTYNTAKANCRHAVLKMRRQLAHLVNTEQRQ
jgi:RNA polymerase sigma-70 factor, ECF subfamily